MKKYTKDSFIFLSLIAFMFLFFNVLVSGAVDFINPANGDTITGTEVKLNVTAVVNEQLANCSFYAKSSLTANSSWTLLGTFSNVSQKDSVNGTFNSKILEDANNYQFNATCRNYTNNINSNLTTASIIVDNTIPQQPSNLQPSDKSSLTSSNAAFSLSAVVVNQNVTSCNYTIARGDTNSGDDYVTGSGTYSGTNCSFTKSFSSTLNNGDWYWFVTVSDETNSSKSGKNILTVGLTGTGGNLAVAQQNQQQILTQQSPIKSNNTIYWIIGIIVVIVIAVIIYRRK